MREVDKGEGKAQKISLLTCRVQTHYLLKIVCTACKARSKICFMLHRVV